MTPKAYVLARPNFDAQQFDSFLSAENTSWRKTTTSSPAEDLVEVAGRVCYMSFGENQSPRSNSDYLKNLIVQGHESVLEHVNWTILISGVSRAFTHQLVRHRAGFSFSQLSQQYHDEHEATFVSPLVLEASPAAKEAWERAIEATKQAYAEIISALDPQSQTYLKWKAKELTRAIHSAARSVMPNATETKIVVTANARAWRHFITVRGSIIGDEEMRMVSHLILGLLKQDAPGLFDDFRVTYPDGLPLIEKVQISIDRASAPLKKIK